jgi:hypothetical protein
MNPRPVFTTASSSMPALIHSQNSLSIVAQTPPQRAAHLCTPADAGVRFWATKNDALRAVGWRRLLHARNRAKKTHQNEASVGAIALSFRAKCMEGVGDRMPERRSKSDFLRVECCEEFDGV